MRKCLKVIFLFTQLVCDKVLPVTVLPSLKKEKQSK